jgi:hypothetical protein
MRQAAGGWRLARILSASESSRRARFASSDESRYVTGLEFKVDAGVIIN